MLPGMSHELKRRWPCIAILPFLFSSAAAQASAGVCQPPAVSNELFVGIVAQDKATLEPPPGSTEEEHRIVDVLLKPASGRWSIGFGHRYTILNVEDITPQTNAHLHTAYFPLHWIDNSDRKSFRASFAPVLSASSNIMGDPEEYRGDTLQLLFALSWRRNYAEWTLRYGICGDHRFGEYTIYPSVGVEWQPHPDVTLDVGFPHIRLTYRFNDRFSSGIGVSPDGNEWHVADRAMTQESLLVYEGYAIDWEFRWEALPDLSISAAIGAPLDSRYELTLLNGERITVGADPVLRVSAGLRWKF